MSNPRKEENLFWTNPSEYVLELVYDSCRTADDMLATVLAWMSDDSIRAMMTKEQLSPELEPWTAQDDLDARSTRWESADGRYWIEVYGDGRYGLSTGGGRLGSYDEAIAHAERMVDLLADVDGITLRRVGGDR